MTLFLSRVSNCSFHLFLILSGEVLTTKPLPNCALDTPLGPITKYPLQANQHETVTLIAGGSGITPMMQIISHVLKNNADKTKIHLIYANVSPQDIILKDELDAYAKAHPDRFKVTYVIDKPAEGWKGSTGYVTAELIKKTIPDIAKGNTKVFVCGPPRKSALFRLFQCRDMLISAVFSHLDHDICSIAMMKTVSGSKGPNFSQGDVDGALKELGLTNDFVFKF